MSIKPSGGPAEEWMNAKGKRPYTRTDIREIQASAMREAARLVASGKAYRLDADPLYEAAYMLEQVAAAIEKGVKI